MATPPISTSTIWTSNCREGGNYPVPCPRDSTHKTFEPTDLTNTYSMCTRMVFGGNRHRTQVYQSGVRCSNH
ncbi:hypothetical protein TNCV_4871471 [Trichonephila clavipes]|nr:hypothetical protein TNCV_4871471 [Trichonephila clavipes]